MLSYQINAPGGCKTGGLFPAIGRALPETLLEML